MSKVTFRYVKDLQTKDKNFTTTVGICVFFRGKSKKQKMSSWHLNRLNNHRHFESTCPIFLVQISKYSTNVKVKLASKANKNSDIQTVYAVDT